MLLRIFYLTKLLCGALKTISSTNLIIMHCFVQTQEGDQPRPFIKVSFLMHPRFPLEGPHLRTRPASVSLLGCKITAFRFPPIFLI